MQAAAIVLGLAAVGGLTLATIRMMGTPRPPTWMALGHGVVALTGLGLLIKEANNPGIPQLAQVALGVIILAVLGGSTLFLGFHMRQRALPIPLVIGHGLIAASGFVLLLVTIFRA
jgi:hypothetical protein